MMFLEYPKCSTCKKAKKYLDDNKFYYVDRNIIISNPTKEELDSWIKLSGKDINKFFNTSGLKYRELNLKDKIKDMSYQEKIELLSSDGMLVKRPLLILDDKTLVGFKVEEWDKIK